MVVTGHRRRGALVVPGAATVAAALAAVTLLGACGGADAGNGPDVPDDAPEVDIDDRCDLGLNTARFNDTAPAEPGAHAHHHEAGPVDFTLADWAGVFVDEELGLGPDEVVDRLATADLEVYRRHIEGGVLTHSLGPDPWTPMTDPGECERLAGELTAVRELVTRYPTVADAIAAGYVQGDTYYAGLGAHYQNWDLLGTTFDPARPVQLLYDGTDPGSHLVGVSYVVRRAGDAPPEGFTGVNDRWHRHRSYCLDLANGGVNLSSDVLSEEECEALGGSFLPNEDGWMLHAWVVPGCESDWGVFSSANPALPFLPEGAEMAPGCNSGRSTTDRLQLDDRGSGPRIKEESPAT
ncbi:MAG TPA: hypothetical protein VIL36_24185 [Acidimicrobiales bacterium]